MIKDSAQLLKVYLKLSSMCNHRSYNLDHSEHVRI